MLRFHAVCLETEQIVGFGMQHRQSQKHNSFQSIKCHGLKKKLCIMFASWSEWKTWNQTPVYSCPLKASLLPMFWPVHPSLTLASPCLAQGVLHTVAGYLLYTSLTFKCVFDYHPGDVYWCTADIGWITGHSYVTYGPLANGATSVLVSFFFLCLCSGRGISIGSVRKFCPLVLF